MTVIPRLPFYPPLVPGEPVPAPSGKQQEMDAVFYPESDGNPIAENTLQFEWIEKIKGNLEAIYADDLDVFIAADLLWYPVEGRSDICAAPDTMVVLGRPKGDRGSYLQWREENIAPQVVFEVLSHTNTPIEMARKRAWYATYGALEYYEYDPQTRSSEGWRRSNASEPPTRIASLEGWISPLLAIRFEYDAAGEFRILRPDGRAFKSFVETDKASEAAERMLLIAEEQREAAEAARDSAEQERDSAEQARQAALLNLAAADEAREAVEQERLAAEQRAARLAERLRALGIEPDEAE